MTYKHKVNKAVILILMIFISFLTTENTYAHSGSLNKVAVEACAEKVKSQACEYEGLHNDLYIGTCQYISETDLICVRNKPIQKSDGKKVESEEIIKKSPSNQ